MSNIILNDENQKLFDNVTKQNLSTFINKYISDTIYIIQLQINSFSNTINTNDNNNLLKSYNGKEMNIFNDEINLIKKINKSLEKEILYLNNPRINDISKIIQVLSQRNDLLNNLMNFFFAKNKLIETKELLLNKKIKSINKTQKIKSLDRKYVNKGPKINFYMENLKKNNEFNYKNSSIHSQIFDNLIYTINSEDSFVSHKKTRNKNKSINQNLTTETLNKHYAKNKNKNNLNQSYDPFIAKELDNLNLNNGNINFSRNDNVDDDKFINNQREKSRNLKTKKRKINSVVKTFESDSLLNNRYDINNNKTKFNLKNIFQLNKLNLEKLNDISSNILLVNHQNKND
jgi:hypothetical protein